MSKDSVSVSGRIADLSRAFESPAGLEDEEDTVIAPSATADPFLVTRGRDRRGHAWIAPAPMPPPPVSSPSPDAVPSSSSVRPRSRPQFTAKEENSFHVLLVQLGSAYFGHHHAQDLAGLSTRLYLDSIQYPGFNAASGGIESEETQRMEEKKLQNDCLRLEATIQKFFHSGSNPDPFMVSVSPSIYPFPACTCDKIQLDVGSGSCLLLLFRTFFHWKGPDCILRLLKYYTQYYHCLAAEDGSVPREVLMAQEYCIRLLWRMEQLLQFNALDGCITPLASSGPAAQPGQASTVPVVGHSFIAWWTSAALSKSLHIIWNLGPANLSQIQAITEVLTENYSSLPLQREPIQFRGGKPVDKEKDSSNNLKLSLIRHPAQLPLLFQCFLRSSPRIQRIMLEYFNVLLISEPQNCSFLLQTSDWIRCFLPTIQAPLNPNSAPTDSAAPSAAFPGIGSVTIPELQSILHSSHSSHPRGSSINPGSLLVSASSADRLTNFKLTLNLFLIVFTHYFQSPVDSLTVSNSSTPFSASPEASFDVSFFKVFSDFFHQLEEYFHWTPHTIALFRVIYHVFLQKLLNTPQIVSSMRRDFFSPAWQSLFDLFTMIENFLYFSPLFSVNLGADKGKQADNRSSLTSANGGTDKDKDHKAEKNDKLEKQPRKGEKWERVLMDRESDEFLGVAIAAQTIQPDASGAVQVLDTAIDEDYFNTSASAAGAANSHFVYSVQSRLSQFKRSISTPAQRFPTGVERGSLIGSEMGKIDEEKERPEDENAGMTRVAGGSGMSPASQSALQTAAQQPSIGHSAASPPLPSSLMASSPRPVANRYFRSIGLHVTPMGVCEDFPLVERILLLLEHLKVHDLDSELETLFVDSSTRERIKKLKKKCVMEWEFFSLTQHYFYMIQQGDREVENSLSYLKKISDLLLYRMEQRELDYPALQSSSSASSRSSSGLFRGFTRTKRLRSMEMKLNGITHFHTVERLAAPVRPVLLPEDKLRAVYYYDVTAESQRAKLKFQDSKSVKAFYESLIARIKAGTGKDKEKEKEKGKMSLSVPSTAPVGQAPSSLLASPNFAHIESGTVPMALTLDSASAIAPGSASVDTLAPLKSFVHPSLMSAAATSGSLSINNALGKAKDKDKTASRSSLFSVLRGRDKDKPSNSISISTSGAASSSHSRQLSTGLSGLSASVSSLANFVPPSYLNSFPPLSADGIPPYFPCCICLKSLFPDNCFEIDGFPYCEMHFNDAQMSCGKCAMSLRTGQSVVNLYYSAPPNPDCLTIASTGNSRAAAPAASGSSSSSASASSGHSVALRFKEIWHTSCLACKVCQRTADDIQAQENNEDASSVNLSCSTAPISPHSASSVAPLAAGSPLSPAALGSPGSVGSSGAAFKPATASSSSLLSTVSDASQYFFFHDSSVYCHRDYYSQFGRICSQCRQYINGEVLMLGDLFFHPNHFLCAGGCGKGLENRQFFTAPGLASQSSTASRSSHVSRDSLDFVVQSSAGAFRPGHCAFCEHCFVQRYKICHFCSELIHDHESFVFLQLGKRKFPYHSNCVKCSFPHCAAPADSLIYSDEELLFCPVHYIDKYASRCPRCTRVVLDDGEGEMAPVTVGQYEMHSGCVNCFEPGCGISLVDQTAYVRTLTDNSGKIIPLLFCERHHSGTMGDIAKEETNGTVAATTAWEVKRGSHSNQQQVLTLAGQRKSLSMRRNQGSISAASPSGAMSSFGSPSVALKAASPSSPSGAPLFDAGSPSSVVKPSLKSSNQSLPLQPIASAPASPNHSAPPSPRSSSASSNPSAISPADSSSSLLLKGASPPQGRAPVLVAKFGPTAEDRK